MEKAILLSCRSAGTSLSECLDVNSLRHIAFYYKHNDYQ